MDFIRGTGRWFLALLVSFSLSVWLLCATLQLTVLNRQVVKGWAQSSGVYANVIEAIPFEIAGEGGQSFITAGDIKAALKTTLNESYVQTHVEAILDSTYDWLEGKVERITFSIPLGEKKTEFAANLAAQLQPKVATLPKCTSTISSSDTPTCIPKGMTAEQFSAKLSNITNSEGQNLLDTALTQDALGNDQTIDTTWLPFAVQIVNWLAPILPILAVVAAAGYVLLSDSKLKGLSIMGHRAFFHGIIVAALGVLIWFFVPNLQLATILPTPDDPATAAAQTGIVQHLVEPLVRNMMPSFGQVGALLGGALAIVGGAVWLVAHMLRRRHESQKSRMDHIEHTPHPLLRAESTEIPEVEPKAPADEPPKPPVAPKPPKPPTRIVM